MCPPGQQATIQVYSEVTGDYAHCLINPLARSQKHPQSHQQHIPEENYVKGKSGAEKTWSGENRLNWLLLKYRMFFEFYKNTTIKTHCQGLSSQAQMELMQMRGHAVPLCDFTGNPPLWGPTPKQCQGASFITRLRVCSQGTLPLGLSSTLKG